VEHEYIVVVRVTDTWLVDVRVTDTWLVVEFALF
jgi:hypothetical protein